MATSIAQDRAYQEKSISEIKAAIDQGAKKILLVLPTGGGKTTVYAKMTKVLIQNRVPSIFVVDRKELVEQARDRLKEQFDIHSGIIMAGVKPTDMPTQVASVQSLIRRKYPPAGVVFIDEAHGCLSKSYQKVIDHYEDQGAIIIGLTATPFRGDGKDVLSAFDVVVHPTTMLELIDEGYLVKAKIYIVKDIDYSAVDIKSGEYDQSQVENILLKSDIAGNVYQQFKERLNCQTVGFCATVDMSKYYCEFFRRRGVNALHVDGNSDKSYRRDAIQSFREKETQLLFNVGLWTQGLDVPSIMAILMLMKTRSPNRYLQIAGRAMRPYKDKKHGIILDFGGNAIEHGLPESYDQEEFDRYNKDNRKKGKPLGKKCPGCLEVIPIASRLCKCGQKFDPVVEEFKIQSGEIKFSMEVFKEDIPTVQDLLQYDSPDRVPTELLRPYFVLQGKNPQQALYIAYNRNHISTIGDRANPRTFAIANNQMAAYESHKGTRTLYERLKKKFKRG